MSDALERLEQISAELRDDQTPHAFFLFNGDAIDYRALVGFEDACQIVAFLTKQHGGEVIETVMDAILDEEEWPRELTAKDVDD